MDILFGLASASSWGTAYFMVRWCTRTIGSTGTVFFTHLVGFFILGVYLIVSESLVKAVGNVHWTIWGWLFVATTCNTIGALANYHAIKVGLLSLVVPINAGYAAFTVLFSLLSGENCTWLQCLGIAATLSGLAIASIPDYKNGSNKKSSSVLNGVIWALFGALAYGVTYWLLGFWVTDELGGIIPTWMMRVNSLLLLGIGGLKRRTKTILKLPPLKTWGIIGGIAILGSAGSIFSLIGYGFGSISVVSTLASLYSLVTLVLAFVILKERLFPRQWAGVAIIVTGVMMLSW